MKLTQTILAEAKATVPVLSCVPAEKLNEALLRMADELEAQSGTILAANEADVARAAGVIAPTMIDRLRLTPDRIHGMAEGVRRVAALPSPLGRVLSDTVRPNGLRIRKVSVSMGVVAIIYESRPNVTSDAAALAFKSGNVVVLRGGKEAFASSMAIVTAIRASLRAVGLPETAVSLIEDTSRASAMELMKANGLIDLLIPRGGAGLIRTCVENATVPCIQTGTGICHVYVDAAADPVMALNIIENAKTSRPSVCNAEEVLLVHRAVAATFLPRLKERLVDERTAAGKTPVQLRCDPAAYAILGGKTAEDPFCVPAGENDFDTEFLDYILAVGVVDDVQAAVAHIRAHSTMHSEAIVTADPAAAEVFLNGVDAAAVYVNASTRFTDGGEFGFGCEMGISTQKLHARGPMGLPELTTYKYLVTGNGQIR